MEEKCCPKGVDRGYNLYIVLNLAMKGQAGGPVYPNSNV